jgi:hypothetical protein
MPLPVILSHYQAAPLLNARRAAQTTLSVSLDLGLTHSVARLDDMGVTFPDGSAVGWAEIEKIAESENACFAVRDGRVEKIHAYSPATNRFCGLMPTTAAPTLLVAGFPMHRIKGTDPARDTQSKIAALKPAGRVLDTCTGLGYTAIAASELAEHVTTIELDPTVLDIARQNPWSQKLFDNPKITQRLGDSYELIQSFEAGAFARVAHDPPTFSLAGELYSAAFYQEVYRVLTPRGRLFHYIGDLESAHGARVAKGVVKRLREAGFATVRPAPQAFGVAAQKA